MTSKLFLSAAVQPVLLNRFGETLRQEGASAAQTATTLLASDEARREEIFYVPFEHINLNAKLVLVGISPGPNQIKLAYESVQQDLRAEINYDDVLAHAKRHAAFGGSRMRPNLLKILRAYDFHSILGITDAAELWGGASDLLHATSVVPHAAFVRGKPFASSFSDVLKSRILRECFERDFAATLPLISREALFVALGKTPLDALEWCVERGLIEAQQLLGAFAHPSSSGGSRVPVYLGEKSPEELESGDPVRHSADWLINAAERMRKAVVARGGLPRVQNRRAARGDRPITAKLRQSWPSHSTTASTASMVSILPTDTTAGLHALVSRGPNAGTVLRPHVSNGCHVISPTNKQKDYTYIPVNEPLEGYLVRGLKLRMSALNIPPSLISPASIRGRAVGT